MLHSQVWVLQLLIWRRTVLDSLVSDSIYSSLPTRMIGAGSTSSDVDPFVMGPQARIETSLVSLSVSSSSGD